MHPNSTVQFVKKEISPKDAPITKIEVFHGDKHICGFKFYSNDKVVLEVGYLNAIRKEVTLEAGERLVGVKSKLYNNTPNDNTVHCNLVMVIGKLE